MRRDLFDNVRVAFRARRAIFRRCDVRSLRRALVATRAPINGSLEHVRERSRETLVRNGKTKRPELASFHGSVVATIELRPR